MWLFQRYSMGGLERAVAYGSLILLVQLLVAGFRIRENFTTR